ncbi:LysM domain receptor-like kinase 3 [Cocos nucifera]|uniref:LysM domain receptor-like kinase 3 n=1 Tax=Cocos nucifera TaxID=13894 RepID=A0A8K0IXE9_COCNU|nr:LysM domain receptor-like kinase 3 [Cocos nucifera]
MAVSRNLDLELVFRSISSSSLFFLFLLASFPLRSESSCRRGCDLAIGSYYIPIVSKTNLTYISSLFDESLADVSRYNPNITNTDSIPSDSHVNVSFRCDLLDDGAFLGHSFSYQTIHGDTYTKIASTYSNLTTVPALEAFNSYSPNQIPDGVDINVTVNCSCGNADVSRDYGLFVTYPLRPGENLSSVAAEWGLSGHEDLLQRYNQGVNFSAGEGIVFIPTTGLSAGAIAGISVAAIVAVLVFAICTYFGVYRRKKGRKASLLPSTYEDNAILRGHGSADASDQTPQEGSGSQLPGFAVDKSVEFSYEELAGATNDFSLSSKIGEGGFGAVYYAELRGEVCSLCNIGSADASDQTPQEGSGSQLPGFAVDKSVEFSYEELAGATNDFSLSSKIGEGGFGAVYYAELRGEVRLLGYCIKDSLFLVYEYIENGNLSQHLRGSGRNPLPWSARVQIALDSARGLEYIHEHTVPQYIHRDIKSANILIDKNFRGKVAIVPVTWKAEHQHAFYNICVLAVQVADFGLTKLTEVGILPDPTRAVGTFGYMPPEYAQLGDVSTKVDVYAFGVVLYELISAKAAVVKTGEATEFKGLVALFEDALSQPDPREHLRKLVDPRLGDNHPIDSVHKMAQLAKACTHENPQLRPNMRSVVVALMMLSSSTEDLDIDALYGNPALINLVSGRGLDVLSKTFQKDNLMIKISVLQKQFMNKDTVSKWNYFHRIIIGFGCYTGLAAFTSKWSPGMLRWLIA